MSVIILGDPHIGAGINIGKVGVGANLNSRIADQLNLLDWTLEQALESVSTDIVITGDIFDDPKPPPILITLFLNWLKRCQINSVNVHLILGNHDIIRSGYIYSSPLDIIAEADLDGIYVYKDISTYNYGTTSFTMVPFRDRKSLGASTNNDGISLLKNIINYELASIPNSYRKILIGHLALEGSIPIGNEIDDIANELFCPLEMFNGYDYVFMGHIHKPQIMSEKPYISHIGSMDISNFGEIDHKKYIIIFDTLSNNFEIKYLPTRSLNKISISVPKDTVDTTDFVIKKINEINEDWNKSIVKIEISLSSPELKSVNKSILEKNLLNKGVFNIAGISETKKYNLVKKNDVTAIHTKMDVPSAIAEYSKINIDPDLRDKFTDLALEIYKEYKVDFK